jgi:hypothetical protein
VGVGGGIIGNKFESVRFILATNTKSIADKERRSEILRIPGAFIRRPNMVTRGEVKKTLHTFQRKMERRILQVVWSDRQTDKRSNKKENQNQ